MKHKIKKIKFKRGKDANRAFLKSLIINFLKKGQITTTLKRIKMLQSYLDRVVSQAKKKKTRELFKKLNNRKLVNFLIEKVAPIFEDRDSGFTTFRRVKVRLSDGSEVGKLTWVKPIIRVKNKKDKKDNETQTNKTNKSQSKK